MVFDLMGCILIFDVEGNRAFWLLGFWKDNAGEAYSHKQWRPEGGCYSQRHQRDRHRYRPGQESFPSGKEAQRYLWNEQRLHLLHLEGRHDQIGQEISQIQEIWLSCHRGHRSLHSPPRRPGLRLYPRRGEVRRSLCDGHRHRRRKLRKQPDF